MYIKLTRFDGRPVRTEAGTGGDRREYADAPRRNGSAGEIRLYAATCHGLLRK